MPPLPDNRSRLRIPRPSRQNNNGLPQVRAQARSSHRRMSRVRVAQEPEVRRARASRDQGEASLRATKGVVTKQKKKLERVSNGVCPCCNRSFQNLARHMASQHPGFQH